MFPLSYVLAHVGRLVEIGKVMRSRGHEVVFAGESLTHPRTRLHVADKEGFRVLYSKEPDQPYAWDRFLKYGWPVAAYDLITHKKWAPLDQIIETQVKLIEREQPDLVVGDATVSVSTAAYITGIAAAGVMNGYAARFVSPLSPFAPAIRVWDKLHLEPIRNRIYARYGRERVDALSLLKQMPMISPDLPGLYDIPGNWPNWQTVGPIMSEPTHDLPSWFDELDDGRVNIYVTMGSTGNMNYFLRRCFDALGRSPYRYIVTTAGQADAETLAMAPKNFRIVKYAPGLAVLKKCRLMVFHGGNGSMYQALWQGVPMIAIPTHLEQAINADLAVKKGFGVRMRLSGITGERLLTTINRMLGDPSYRTAARQYSDVVQTMNGAANSADILERTAMERSAQATTYSNAFATDAAVLDKEALLSQQA